MSLNALLGAKDETIGRGLPNGGRYSNARFDAIVEEAMGTIDNAQRGKLLAQATDMAMADVALILLLYAVSIWACRSDLRFEAPTKEYTSALRARPV